MFTPRAVLHSLTMCSARNDLYKVDYVIDIDEETRDEVKDQRMRRWTGVNFANLKELTLGQM